MNSVLQNRLMQERALRAIRAVVGRKAASYSVRTASSAATRRSMSASVL
jgi:hypothetical protein